MQIQNKDVPLHPQSQRDLTGCSSARLEYTSGGRVVAGSNPVTPTKPNRSQGAVVQLVRIHACHAWGRGFESRPHRLRKKTETRKSKTISSKSVTLGIFFCYTTTDEYPVGSRKLDKSSNQIVTKKKNGNFGYDFVDMSLICRCLRSILSTRRNLKS